VSAPSIPSVSAPSIPSVSAPSIPSMSAPSMPSAAPVAPALDDGWGDLGDDLSPLVVPPTTPDNSDPKP
jgi:hypothetical protein